MTPQQLRLPLGRETIYPVNEEYHFAVLPKHERYGWRVACVFVGESGGIAQYWSYRTEAEAHWGAAGLAANASRPPIPGDDDVG